MDRKKILVAYFSWSGHTLQLARIIAGKLGADMFEIVREAPYPAQYTACTEEAEAEKMAGARPALRSMPPALEQYDAVFVGTATWWYGAPMPVLSFLERADLRGKTVVAFCTCGEDPGSTLRDIARATPGSRHPNGFCIAMRDLAGEGVASREAEIGKWLEAIGSLAPEAH